jgi:hypothetical protein
MRGRRQDQWWGVALEAPDAAALARLYAGLLDWTVAGGRGATAGDGARPARPGRPPFLPLPRALTSIWSTDLCLKR